MPLAHVAPLVRLSFALLVLPFFCGCAQLPSLADRPASHALSDTAGTRLGQAVAPLVAANSGRSGVVAINHGRDAFAARAMLAEAAERSLDVQYYIWRRDLSGSLLFAALRRAADRGVRVRLLLDDNNSTPELDETLAALDAHPRIEVRLFNPFLSRRSHVLGYLTDFPRLNRRMHNKSFTVDNQAAIIGGRNVGDEYFDAAEATAFVDLDALAVGPVVNEVSRSFDAYWWSDSAYPVDRLLPRLSAAEGAARIAAFEKTLDAQAAKGYLQAVAQGSLVQDLLARRLELEWSTVRVVADDPAKALGQAPRATNLLPRLSAALGHPTQTLQIVTPYFVPTASGTEAFVALAKEGVRIEVLTNALEATDVAAVHAGYAKWRKPLLRGGISLSEMKRLAPGSGSTGLGVPVHSASSLHAKTIGIDHSRVFIGSFNFDPRSDRYNTEIGFVIESQSLARRLAEVFSTQLPDYTYLVRLDAQGHLAWEERRGGEVVVHSREPGASFWKRSAVTLLGWLPIEWLL